MGRRPNHGISVGDTVSYYDNILGEQTAIVIAVYGGNLSLSNGSVIKASIVI